MKSLVLVGLGAAFLVGASSQSALAEETAKPAAKKKGEEVMEVVKIKGKRQRPAAVLEILRKEQTLPLAELKQPLADRITDKLDKSPF